jgi:hypothetical protein
VYPFLLPLQFLDMLIQEIIQLPTSNIGSIAASASHYESEAFIASYGIRNICLEEGSRIWRSCLGELDEKTVTYSETNSAVKSVNEIRIRAKQYMHLLAPVTTTMGQGKDILLKAEISRYAVNTILVHRIH